MKRRQLGPWTVAFGLLEIACFIPAEDVGSLLSGTTSDDTTAAASQSESGGATGQDTIGSASQPESGGSESGDDPAPSSCGPDGPACDEDEDRDCVGLSEDNAPDVYNPDQRDVDEDGLADLVDLCPSVPSLPAADSDHDGLGNECDPCRRVTSAYQADVSVPAYLRVRNVPSSADADGDGIGDACDNCIHVPNCEGYGAASPWQPGDPIADGDPDLCQQDDGDGIGQACEGLPPLPGAAGPVGLGPDDDFDQDGLTNEVDACPRAPLGDAIACSGDGDCPAGRRCEIALGLCDHDDVDDDGVGDVCDSCLAVANPLQLDDVPIDDEDGDFRGQGCELGLDCAVRRDPARLAFYPVSVEGWCCTVAYRGDDASFDPLGVPLRLDCTPEAEAAQLCRKVPAALASTPGLVAPPPGCEPALAAAGLTLETHLPLAAEGGLEALWPYACWLPPLDQDFDGLGDACDLCPLAFDPENTPYIDDAGTLWPNDGAYCNGEFSTESICMGA